MKVATLSIILGCLLSSCLCVKFETTHILDTVPDVKSSYFGGIAYQPSTHALSLSGNIDHENVSVMILSQWSPEQGYGPAKSFQITVEGYSGCNGYTTGYLSGTEYASFTYVYFSCQPDSSENKSTYFLAKLSSDHEIVDCISVNFDQKAVVGPIGNPAFLESSIVLIMGVTSANQVIVLSGNLESQYQLTQDNSITTSVVGIPNSDSFVIGSGGAGAETIHFAVFNSEGVKQSDLDLSYGETILNMVATEDRVFVCIFPDMGSGAEVLTFSRDLKVLSTEKAQISTSAIPRCVAGGNTVAVTLDSTLSPFSGWVLSKDGSQTDSFEYSSSSNGFNFQSPVSLMTPDGKYILAVGLHVPSQAPAFTALNLQEDSSEFQQLQEGFQTTESLLVLEQELTWVKSNKVEGMSFSKVTQAKLVPLHTSNIDNGEFKNEFLA